MNIQLQIKKAIKGKRKAQIEVYTVLHAQLKPICMRYAKDEQQASSLCNEALYIVLNKLDQLEDHSKLFAWAKQIQFQIIFEQHRKSKSSISEVELTEQDYSNAFIDHINEYHDLEYLLSLVRQLPQVTQLVFNLFVIDGYSHKEIAEQLNIVVGTSKWHLSQAKKILREKLSPESKTIQHV